MNRIRFAIVGCGAITARHVVHIQAYGQLVAVCDVVADKALLFANKYRVPCYFTINDLLAGETVIDVVVICTPNGLHAGQCVQLLQKGMHVLVEKPMALTVSDCERMIRTAELSGKQLFTVMQNRFNPPVQAVKKILDAGGFGQLYGMQLTCFWNRDQHYYQSADWRGSQSQDGGVLFTQFSHFIDLVYWFFGEVQNVLAMTENLAHRDVSEIDDCGAVILQFRNGMIGTIHYSVNSFQQNREGSLTISGEKGMVKIGGTYLNTIEYTSFQDQVLEQLPAGSGANEYGTYQGSMSNHDKVYESLVNTLENGTPYYTSSRDGLKTVEIIEKIYRAANLR
ncbi:MAG: Gfo/Idh/MocA family oxidoreductase [Bacteroidetes bacterium]|nr:Gfo/Idh/MocA family oxidoreductase [Bacteroidota bacterium]